MNYQLHGGCRKHNIESSAIISDTHTHQLLAVFTHLKL